MTHPGMIDQLQQRLFIVAEQERKERINEAWKAYRGELEDPLKPTEDDPKGRDNVKLNLSGLIVEKSVSFLFGFDLQFEVDGEADTEAEAWLRDCLDANHRMTLLHKLGINGAVAGHCFLRIRLPDEAQNGHPYPRLVVWDPGAVDVRWSPEDCERVESFTYSWHGIDPNTARPVAYRQVVARDGGRWTITDEVSKGSNTQWEARGATLVWPFPWCPVLHCQNVPNPNEFWGKSDLEEPVRELNHSVNFVASNNQRLTRMFAHPLLWGRGFNDKVDRTPGRIIILPGQHSEMRAVDLPTDLPTSLEVFRELKSAFFTISRVPEVAAGRVEDLGQLSGLALQILYGPLVELTRTKRLTYGELLQDLARRLLEMGKHGDKRRVEPQWPSVLPEDEKGKAETALVKKELGFSDDTLITEMGGDPKAEAKKRKQEAKEGAALGNALLDGFNRGGKEVPPDDEDDEG